MSAALQFPSIARAAAAQRHWKAVKPFEDRPANTTPGPKRGTPRRGFGPVSESGRYALESSRIDSPLCYEDELALDRPAPAPNLAFYRKHTENLLRRYLYASILVGRTPANLANQSTRGWASHRRMETFEDCVIFVLDMEKALAGISALDRLLLTRIVLQEYSVSETALLLNKSHRNVNLRLAEALDKLTRILLDNRTLTIPVPRPADREFSPPQ